MVDSEQEGGEGTDRPDHSRIFALYVQKMRDIGKEGSGGVRPLTLVVVLKRSSCSLLLTPSCPLMRFQTVPPPCAKPPSVGIMLFQGVGRHGLRPGRSIPGYFILARPQPGVS